MPTTAATIRALSVPGATLHFQIEGDGPVLVLSQSGEGDADRTVDLVPHLADRFTVVTYDRRGLSRSTLDDPARPVTMADHADDVARLITEVGDGPALMAGFSMGAAIGLQTVARHPGLVSTLIAHEPVMPNLLSEADRAEHVAELKAIQDAYTAGGLEAAFPAIARHLGIDPAHDETEEGLTPQPLTIRRKANFAFFIGTEFTAVTSDDHYRDEPVPAATAAGTRIIPATGRTTRSTVHTYRCALALAAQLDTEPVQFPGGHNGNTAFPRATAKVLKDVLGLGW
ncbi:alpha/beta fold hydrolase [Streptomyces stelliscabiei]|uniref:Pimeloyl-ACP methyl ester carboxylesterase n=1 Tax=Streptomyces stelliscabiei TaxID=146820 RepID=A0A8I0NVJ8_9ACTN|nr:alpha/beta hydrolase [Streptomyces stelliscabiei]MBE1594358.1 pimeloyl-ACP methyl ester carboxylesterase [Streptomyces stelliscabiei]MDX2522060.1 alpha/beta hydrolase [Streptomyces stelliscabiei]MDX2557965.1 alpha/beta hydrolase [Streptomyces stelliscabiei]MDX2617770.1 alpha/beta hydrolase [Streptomyces stelliscabiei]MDX2641898.1 alpha/beta hydrolase [Streptomyces stelliscabiei]